MGKAVHRVPPLAEASALHTLGSTGATAVGAVENSCGRVNGSLEVADGVDRVKDVADRRVAGVLEVEGC